MSRNGSSIERQTGQAIRKGLDPEHQDGVRHCLNDRTDAERPVPPAGHSEDNRGHRADHPLGCFDKCQGPESQRLLEQCRRDRPDPGNEQGGAHGRENPGHARGVEELPQRPGGRHAKQHRHPAEQDSSAIQLRQFLFRQVPHDEHGGSHPELGEQAQEADVDRRAPDNAVVLRGEQPGHEQRTGPGQDLDQPLHPSGPGKAVQEGLVHRVVLRRLDGILRWSRRLRQRVLDRKPCLAGVTLEPGSTWIAGGEVTCQVKPAGASGGHVAR